MTTIQQPSSETRPPYQLEMRVAADPAWLPSLRVVAADLATRADFDLDTVSDLRMAVDEACAELVGAARPAAVLVCRFMLDDDGVTMTATVAVADETTIPRDEFGWRVLCTLADEVEVIEGHADEPGASLGLRLRKLRRLEAA